MIKVNEGRNFGEVKDGNWFTRQFDRGDALTSLQEIHGWLAYQILYQRDKALPYSQNQIVQEATKIPQKAFEAYVKAVQLPLRNDARFIYLKNALHYYAESLGGAVYPQAAFELGRGYMDLGNWKEATEYFSKLQKKEPHYAEAAFYASLGYMKLGDYGRALATVVPLSSDLPLIAVYNNAGAVAVQAARENKNEAEKTRLLTQGNEFLSQASKSAPSDQMVHFNYGYALFLAGKYSEAAEHFRPVITSDPQDGQAYFLFSKSLAKLGNTEAATAADDMARRYLRTAYAKWETEWQKSQTTSGVNVRTRDVLNREEIFGLSSPTEGGTGTPSSATQDLLIKARDLYQAGRDEEALPELHRVVMIEPTNAEAYLLSGRINLRRSDQEAAIAALKTAIFWDPKLIDAHILLGRIFLERGDRGEARKYALARHRHRPQQSGSHRSTETGHDEQLVLLIRFDRRGAGRARSGQHPVAARPLGESEQDRRRAGGPGRRARGAGGVSHRAADRRGAGRARSGQHPVAARPLGQSRQDRRRAGGPGRRARGAGGVSHRAGDPPRRWPRAIRPTPSGSATSR